MRCVGRIAKHSSRVIVSTADLIVLGPNLMALPHLATSMTTSKRRFGDALPTTRNPLWSLLCVQESFFCGVPEKRLARIHPEGSYDFVEELPTMQGALHRLTFLQIVSTWKESSMNTAYSDKFTSLADIKMLEW